MIGQFFKFLTNKMSCALLGAQGIGVSKISPILLESANAELTDTGFTVNTFLTQLLDWVGEIINSWIYVIAKYILAFIDFCQVITYKIAGIDNDLEKILEMPIFKFLLNETVLKVIGSIMVLSLILLILVTIVAIVKSEYEASFDDKKDPKNVAYKTIGKSFVSLFLMVVTPFIIIIAIIFSSVMLSSINNVLNPNDSEQATLGGTLFKTAAYNANKYRMYAADGKRIPILLNFDDPYENGTYGFYTSEQLYEIYEGWNGQEIYDKFAVGNFANFNDTLVYKNGKIYNSNDYRDYERFVSTTEQYYVMADFIDYAISHDITYYIKNSRDEQIDWSRTSSEIKISDGVYDPYRGTITLTYTDVSNLAPYDDFYTITFETSTASASTPITNAVSTISLILGLNTIVSGQTGKDIALSPSVGQGGLNNTSLSGSAEVVEGLLQEIASTSESSNVTFRLLERVEGSLNVVRWQTEKAIDNSTNQEYTVYNLRKVERNPLTGINEVKATVKVAKKDDSLNSKYYVVSEEPNSLGYYDYTNVQIDYYNDGEDYLDTLDPIFKKATWPKKLYNDLSVIYSDIDFDNYLSYDNWADALGTYYKTDNNATTAEVSSFATTLVHPLGLIMSELFLGTTLEGENGTTSSFSFTSSYLDDIIDSLTLSVGGQFDFKNMSYQIDNFITLFNGQFASVMESLKRIEGFDVYGNDELSVQGEVYKAYLASIMLSTDYSNYLNNIADTLLTSEKLIELIEYGAGSVIYDQNGSPVYKIIQLTDGSGELIPLYYNDETPSPNLLINGKAVYRSDGNKLYTANDSGVLDSSGIYIPKKNTQYIIEKHEGEKHYHYSVYVDSLSEYVKAADLSGLGLSISDYFETYYFEQGGIYYVYEPSNGDTSMDIAIVTNKVLAENATELTGKHLDYFLYEVEAILDTDTSYLTYGELPEVYQNFVDRMISTIQHDCEVGKYDEPVFLEFLEEYQADGIQMADIMSAEIISSKTAKNYLESRDFYEKKVEHYTELVNESVGQLERLVNQMKLDEYKAIINQMKKFYIINGIESFASTQTSSGFTVIVNSHPYNVTQGMVQRELLETIYGNNLLYKSIIGKMSNGTAYNELGAFDKNAFEKLIGFVQFFNSEIETICNGTTSDALLFSGTLTDKQLEILEIYYSVNTGISQKFTNSGLVYMLEQGKQELLDYFLDTAHDTAQIIDNYMNNRQLTIGLIKNRSVSECYAILELMIKSAVGDAQLFFVENDYYGLIDENYEGFTLLRRFLKDFGDLCFDLARKSNLDTIGEHETENILDYINSFVQVLNVRLQDLELGEDIKLEYVENFDDLKTIDGENVTGSTQFNELSKISKAYVYTIFDVYGKKVADYELKLQSYKDAWDYTKRYIKGRYAMQSDSFIFAEGLKEYLNNFRYNTDIDRLLSRANLDAGEYCYIYDTYTGSLETFDDRLYYYNLYLDSFDGFNTGVNGIYYDGLTDLQKKVIVDMELYFKTKYEEFTAGTNAEYNQNLLKYQVLNKFISNETNFDDMGSEITPVSAGLTPTNVKELITANINLLNLYNLLDFVGIEYNINKTLSDYRLDALNSLVSFKERAGESGASIQARYLTLLYIVCADYTVDVAGQKIIAIDANTKQAILKLAGLNDVAEENLVGLEYEVVDTNAISDEKFGSVYIICTYNAETNMYEPFVFANKANSFGTPVSSYYSSEDGSVKFFPVIAKGLIGPDGLPTAIREVNGYIEFYRESASIKDPGSLGLDMYYMSIEDVSINYNPVNVIVNGITGLFTGKSVAERIIESVPVIISSKNLNLCYGTKTDYVYHLDNGEFTLNYMFFNETGIALNCLYKASEFNALIMMFGTLLLATSLISAMFGVLRNLYDLIIIVMLYPGVLAMYPIKDSMQGNWRKQFIDKLLIMFGYIIAINGFFLILNLLQTMEITLVLSESSKMELKNTWLFGSFDMESILNTLFTFVLFMVAVSLVKTLPDFFSKLIGGSDVVKRGENTQKLVKINLEEASYFSSGYAIEDMIQSKADSVRNLPLIGSETRAPKKEQRQLAANKALVKRYDDKLKNDGVSDNVREKAVKAYQDSLNRQVEAQRQRRVADLEARKARIAKHNARLSNAGEVMDSEWKKDKKKSIICPRCKYENEPKSKECRKCGQKLK